MLFNTDKRGVSLLEILIVLTILSVLAVIVINSFSTFRAAHALNEGTEQLLSLLNQARAQTLSSVGGSQYGVHVTANQLTLFKGGTYASGSTSNVVVSINPAVTYTWALAGGGSDVIFKRLTGKTENSGTITITVGAQTRIITISQTGLAGVN